tara:strand:- start:33962 stop:34915 length:954 start_codon:yes stop_codon:yes gene_type:complete
MLVLAEEFKKDTDFSIIFVTNISDVSRDILSNYDFKHIQSPCNAGDINELEFFKNKDNLLSDRSVWILDSKRINRGYCESLKKYNQLIVLIDDELFRHYDCDLIINNNIYAKQSCYKNVDERKLLLGTEYNLIDKKYFFTNKDKVMNSLLITLGGEDPNNDTSWLIENFHEYLSENLVTIIVGPAHPDSERVVAVSKKYLSKAAIIFSPPDLSEYISCSTLVISAGGTTTYEVLAGQTHLACISLEEHQDKLIMNLVKEGLASALCFSDDRDVDIFRGKLKAFLRQQDTLMEHRSICEKYFRMCGAEKIMGRIKQLH